MIYQLGRLFNLWDHQPWPTGGGYLFFCGFYSLWTAIAIGIDLAAINHFKLRFISHSFLVSFEIAFCFTPVAQLLKP
jgi:hypothetical protein